MRAHACPRAVPEETSGSPAVAEAVLSVDERAGGVCLSCRAVPVTDVVVQLQDGDRLRSVWPPRLRAAHQAAEPAH